MADGRGRWGRAVPAAALALAAFVVVAGAARAAEPLRVVATFSILADLVRQVGAEDVAVTVLVPAGGDIHAYEATPRDAQALAAADVVILNGLGLEGWMTRLVEASGTRARIVVASSGVAAVALDAEEGEGGGPATDPHAWQDLANGQTYVRNIADGLAAADPERAGRYRQRAEAYLGELRDLDAWVRGEIARVPAEKRRIITSHDAFGYFGRAYGVTFRAPVGLGTEAEPTAAGLARLIGQIRNEGIRAVFIESMTDPRLMEQLAKDTGAVVGGVLYSDSLSPPGGPAGSYVEMFRHNVPAMVAAMLRN